MTSGITDCDIERVAGVVLAMVRAQKPSAGDFQDALDAALYELNERLPQAVIEEVAVLLNTRLARAAGLI